MSGRSPQRTEAVAVDARRWHEGGYPLDQLHGDEEQRAAPIRTGLGDLIEQAFGTEFAQPYFFGVDCRRSSQANGVRIIVIALLVRFGGLWQKPGHWPEWRITSEDFNVSEWRPAMEFKIDPRSLHWWFWAITLVAMTIGLTGRQEGFYTVILVSAVQTGYFWIRQGFTAFPTQVRTVYGALTVVALFDPTRLFYWALLVGTIMVTFFGRCIIARVLAHMPWNKDVALS